MDCHHGQIKTRGVRAICILDVGGAPGQTGACPQQLDDPGARVRPIGLRPPDITLPSR